MLLNAPQPSAAAHSTPANTPPVILQAVEVTRAHTVVAFRITFTKDVNPGPLSSLSHYALFSKTQNNPYAGVNVPLASASYDPATRTLTLTPASHVRVAPYIVASPNPDDQSTAFIADAENRPLLTRSRKFVVYFTGPGSSPRNLVLTNSPDVNRMTGANLYAYYLTMINDEKLSNRVTNALIWA